MKRFLFILVSFFFIFGTITPVFSYVPSDPLYPKQSYLQQINIESAWDIAKGKGVVVAVLDTGTDIDHPDLKFNIWQNNDEIAGDGIDNDSNGYVDDVNGWDFVNDVPDPKPKFEDNYNDFGMHHGTAIAGLIAATANNKKGIAGVSFYSKIMPLRILASDGSGSVASLIKAIQYAVDNGADIINLSLVGNDYSSNLKNVIKWAYDQGVLIVAAAGNTDSEGNPIDLLRNPTYPACYGDNEENNWVLAISSVDRNDRKSDFASYGLGCVDFMAPGENLASLSFYTDEVEGFDKYYSYSWSGTSVATALISGTVALIKSSDFSLTPSQIVSALQDGAEDIYDQNTSLISKLGFGRVDTGRSVNIASGVKRGYIAKLADSPAVYYVDANNKRHLFSNESTYWSWYNGSWIDQEVEIISQEAFDDLTLGSNITARPGVNLVKFENSPRVYAVTEGAVLCQVDERARPILYGDDWQNRVIVIQNSFEVNYIKNRSCVLSFNSKYPTGTLIQYQDSSDIWYIENDRKRQVLSGAFSDNEFKGSAIIRNVSPAMTYLIGSPISGLERNIFLYRK